LQNVCGVPILVAQGLCLFLKYRMSIRLPAFGKGKWATGGNSGSLSDLKEIGCKSVWLVYISPLFRPIEQLLAFKIVKIYPHPVTFSLRSFKSDRLLVSGSGFWLASIKCRSARLHAGSFAVECRLKIVLNATEAATTSHKKRIGHKLPPMADCHS